MIGDNPRVIEWFHKALAAAPDPFHTGVSQTYLGMGLVLNDRFEEALDHLKEVSFHCDICDNHWLGPITDTLLGVVMVAEGKLSAGVNKLEKARKLFVKQQRGFYIAFADFIMGKIFLKMAQRSGSISTLNIIANFRFLLKNAPFADLKAEDHFNRTIARAKQIGAAGLLGQAYFDLALVHKSQKRFGQARKFVRKAIPHFKACHATVFLKDARQALAELGP